MVLVAVLEATALVEAAEKVETAPRQDAKMVEAAALVESTGQAATVKVAAHHCKRYYSSSPS